MTVQEINATSGAPIGAPIWIGARTVLPADIPATSTAKEIRVNFPDGGVPLKAET